MKFATYELDGTTRSGVLPGDVLCPLAPGRTLADLLGDGLPALLAAGSAAKDRGPGDPLREVRLLAPVSPGATRDYTTFEQHVEGMLMGFGQAVPATFFDSPTFYFSNPYAVTGPYHDIPIAPGSERFDYEIELAAIIGPAGKDLTVEQARDHIIGYTIFNDWSARDIAERELKNLLGPAKAKDTASTFGPYLVTADEVGQRRDPDGFLHLEMTVSIGGQLIGKDTFASMAWTFEELIAHASRGTWVRPGDVIGSGTCGSGCLAEMWGRYGKDWRAPLQAGDEVTATIELIGEPRNRIVAGTVPAPVPPGRPGKAQRR
jgi:2-keto-4-pentenoate hydratase/2-oxohepta-3-ene-1,7-dioic acid hydratase in catechol pathway